MSRWSLKRAISELRSRILLRWPIASYSALPFITFLILVVSSFLGFAFTSSNLASARELAIQKRFYDNELSVKAVLSSYVNLLRGSAGVMQSGVVSQKAWSAFISSYDMERNFNGVEAVGIAEGNTPQTTVVTYTSPLTDLTRQEFGVSTTTVPEVTSALESAAKTGEATFSDTRSIIAARPNAIPKGNSLMLVKPFYDTSLPLDTSDGRLKALRGYAFLIFRGDVFFNELYQADGLNGAGLQVYSGDVKPQNLQFQSQTDIYVPGHEPVVEQQKLDLYGKELTFVYTMDTDKIALPTANPLPRLVLFGGLIFSVLVSGTSGYMLRNRYRKLMHQKERDVNFAKDELLSLASHQLRTPATGVKQYLGMVLQGYAGSVSDVQRNYLERAYSSNNRQLHIINDILHLAKLEAGRIVLAETKFDLADMLREVVDEQRDDAKNGEVLLAVQAPSSGMIVADSHMLRMVIENLVSNAIKYTEQGGTVTVRLAKRGMHWTLVVKDTGVGIAGKDLSKLFKQFSRISNTRTEFVTGTGIGLYLAHHLVVLHGGSIGVTSQAGKGSTFTVRLPRKM